MSKTLIEIRDTSCHIILGGISCFAFFPTAEWWMLILFTGGCGAIREHVQILRKHKQGRWFKYRDVAEFIVGAVLFMVARYFGLSAD